MTIKVDTVQVVPCASRDYGRGSVVCVCNSTYCDNFPELDQLKANTAEVYESNKNGLRFSKTTLSFGNFEQSSSLAMATVRITVDASKQYQSINGFGGCWTDAAVLNMFALTPAAREKLLDSYFSTDGIEYTLTRVPIGGTDFSTRIYTYDDGPEDENLSRFSLSPEDLNYKVSNRCDFTR